MLGQTGGEFRSSSTYGPGNSSITPIILDNVVCTGSEATLNNCSYQETGHNCGHYEDAGVICNGECTGWNNSCGGDCVFIVIGCAEAGGLAVPRFFALLRCQCHRLTVHEASCLPSSTTHVWQ